MKENRLGGKFALMVGSAFLALSICVCFCKCVPVQADELSPVTQRTVYSYNENVGEKNTTLDVPVVPGMNYIVTITFTGREEDIGKDNVKPVRIYYEDVMEDQCYANIQSPYVAQGVDDRSALLYEKCTFGTVETRTFTVACIDDSMKLVVVGDAKLLDIIVEPEEVKTAGDKRTIFVIGDSLVQTYNAKSYPMTGWGQRLNEFFTDDILVSNHALGGRSTMNFIKQGRLNAVLTNVKPGDYVFVTFGHNDAGAVAGRACTVDKYQNYLEEWYIEGVRQRGGIPVMVTLGNQNNFGRDDGKILPSFPTYVAAMKTAAANKGCALIDLNEKSMTRFQEIHDKLGAIAMRDLVFHGFRPGIYDTAMDGSGDTTHFQTYGAWILASLVAEGVKEEKLEGLAEYYVPPVTYDKVPEGVTGLTLNTRDFDEKYTHMDWKAAERAEYYIIERASLSADGTVSDFEVYGYSPVTMFADNKREEGFSYCYRVFAVNNFGQSEDADNWLPVGEKGNELAKKLNTPAKGEETVDLIEKDKDKAETSSGSMDEKENEEADADLGAADEGMKNQTKNRLEIAVFIALFAAVYFIADYFRNKKRGGK